MHLRKSLLLGLGLLAALLLSFAAAKSITLWDTVLVNDSPSKQPFLKYVKENAGKYLPQGYTLKNDFGSPLYRDNAQQFLISARSGTPDVIEDVLEDFFTFYNAKLLQPLNDQFNSWADKDQFVPSTLKALTIDGKLYGIPYDTNVRMLLYRKDILAKYNLTVPTTWDELLHDAQVISKGESANGMYGYCPTTKNTEVRTFQEYISFFFQVNGGENPFKLESGKWVMNTTPDKLAKPLELYQALYDTNNSADAPASNPNARGSDWKPTDYGYAEGKCAMVSDGPWMYSHRLEGATQKKIMTEETGIAQLPLPQNGVHATYLEVKPIMVNAYSKDKDAAWDTVKLLTNNDVITLLAGISGDLPPRKDSAAKLTPWQQSFFKYLDTGVALAPVNWGEPKLDIGNAVQAVIYGQMSPADAGQKLYNQFKALAQGGKL